MSQPPDNRSIVRGNSSRFVSSRFVVGLELFWKIVDVFLEEEFIFINLRFVLVVFVHVHPLFFSSTSTPLYDPPNGSTGQARC